LSKIAIQNGGILSRKTFLDEKPCNAHAMSKRKFSGENNLVIAYAHADRSEGGAKYGLSFDWRIKNKLQTD